MVTLLKELRSTPRIKVKLFLHIFEEMKMYNGTSVDLSCWGIRFKTSQKLETGDLVKISFIYKCSYVIGTKIVEKISEEEYRGLFIFDDLNKRFILNHRIEKELGMH